MSMRDNTYDRRSYEGEPNGAGVTHAVTHAVTLEHSDYHYYDVSACGRYADELSWFSAPKDQAITCLRCMVQVLRG